MILAIISYPYHYHITQLAIKHVLANVEGITDVKVIWDDSTIPAPNTDYIPFSKVCDIPKNIKGWYAQQIIKLNLHRVMSGDILILDGDVVFNQTLDFKKYFYAPCILPKFDNFSKIKGLLNLEQYDFFSIRFMSVESKWLKELHEYNNSINEYYCSIARSDWTKHGRWPLSEWELIYYFSTEILKVDKQLKHINFLTFETATFEQKFDLYHNYVLAGNDNLSIDFYQKHNIPINEILWKQIYGALV